MAGGIQFNFLANVKDFLKGTTDMEGALDEVGGSLDDVAKDAQRSTDIIDSAVGDSADKIGDLGEAADDAGREIKDGLDDASRSFDDLAKDAKAGGDGVERAMESVGDETQDAAKVVDSETEKMADDFRALAKEVNAQSKKIGDDIGSSTKRGTADAKGGLKDFKEESASTAKESAASFDGSADSIADAFQEVAANAFIGFGPAGAAAGIAIALGLGAAIAAGQDAAKAVEEAKQRVGELTLELIDAEGDISRIDIAAKIREWSIEIQDNKEWFEIWQEDSVSNLDRVRTMAHKTGIDLTDMLLAMSGHDADAAVRVSMELGDEIERLQGEIDKIDPKSYEALGGPALSDLKWEYVHLNEEILKASGLNDEAVANAELLIAATDRVAEAQKLQTAEVELLNDAYDEVAESVTDYIDDETGLFDTAAYITAMKERETAIENYQETLASTPLSPAAKAWLNSQGIESAATFLAGYKAATPEQQKELNRIWTEAGSESSGKFTENLGSGVKGYTPPTVTVPLAVNDWALRSYTPPAIWTPVVFYDSRTGRAIAV